MCTSDKTIEQRSFSFSVLSLFELGNSGSYSDFILEDEEEEEGDESGNVDVVAVVDLQKHFRRKIRHGICSSN